MLSKNAVFQDTMGRRVLVFFFIIWALLLTKGTITASFRYQAFDFGIVSRVIQITPTIR